MNLNVITLVVTSYKRVSHLRNGNFHFHESYARKYPPSVVQLSLRLAEVGWLYSQVNSFCENMAEDRDSGLIGQSLVTALKNELSEYYRLLSTVRTHKLIILNSHP